MKQTFVDCAAVGRACVLAVALIALLIGNPTAAQSPVWVPQGAAPTTGGGVEHIENEEVEGAIKAVAPHPTDPKIVYIGAVNGGIWKTANALDPNPVWQQLSDNEKSQSIGALAFDPTDKTYRTMVAGIGRFSSFYYSGGALTGLLYSKDGGAKWTPIHGCNALTNVNVIGVAPRGNTIVVSSDSEGVFRGTVTGCFTRISAGEKTGLPAGASYDLAPDPTNPARLFTNAGTLGIYRSTDTGATWTKVSNAAIDQLLKPGVANVKIAVGRHNNVYVAIALFTGTPEYPAGRLTGIFRSGDGGKTWKPLDLPRTVEMANFSYGLHTGDQADRHFSIAADPTNANIVYLGGDSQPAANEGLHEDEARWPNSIGAQTFSGRLFRIDASRPAGSQATHITHSNTKSKSAPHADSRGMAFAANGMLLEVDDGGIYRRTDPRSNSGDWFSMNGNLQTGEIHSIAWDANARIIIGGTQDNGTPQQMTASGVRWETIAGGDGGFVAVDDFGTPGQSIRYSSTQWLWGFLRARYNASNMLQDAQYLKPIVRNNGAKFEPQFYTPIELNAVAPRRLIIAGNNSVYETDDQGNTMVEIGPRIRVNDSGPIAYGGKGNPDILYVGSGNSVYVRESPSPAPLVESAESYPGGTDVRVVGIALDPDQPRVAYVIDEVAVYRTPDAGASWQPITGNLPSFDPGALRSVVYSSGIGDGAVVVGTNVGVFMAPGPQFSQWSKLGSGMPTVPVMRLKYSAKDRILVAATLGRGAWTLDLSGQKKP